MSASLRTPNKMPCGSGLLPAMPVATPTGRARKGAPTTAYPVLIGTLSPRMKYYALHYGAALGGSVLIAVLMFLISPWFFLLIIVWLIYTAVLSASVQCPKCHKPVGWICHTTRGPRIGYWRFFVPRECLNCGHDLTKPNALLETARPSHHRSTGSHPHNSRKD